MMRTLLVGGIALTLLTLTGCGNKPATIEDCAAYYVAQDAEPADALTVCAGILEMIGQEEFDRNFGG